MITLRPLTPEDITENYLAWFRDPEVTRHLAAKNITREDAIKHLEAGVRDNYRVYAILSDDRHVGNVKVGPIRDGVSDLVTVIGDKRSWSRGVASEAIKQASAKGFASGVMRYRIGVMEGNGASEAAYAKAGFVADGQWPDGSLCMGLGHPMG